MVHLYLLSLQFPCDAEFREASEMFGRKADSASFYSSVAGAVRSGRAMTMVPSTLQPLQNAALLRKSDEPVAESTNMFQSAPAAVSDSLFPSRRASLTATSSSGSRVGCNKLSSTQSALAAIFASARKPAGSNAPAHSMAGSIGTQQAYTVRLPGLSKSVDDHQLRRLFGSFAKQGDIVSVCFEETPSDLTKHVVRTTLIK